jgi:hypothetical protein
VYINIYIYTHPICAYIYLYIMYIYTHTHTYVHVCKSKVHPTTCHKGTDEEQTHSCILTLTSALDWGGWLRPRPGRFTAGNEPVSIVDGGWVGDRAGLDGRGKSRSQRTSRSE